MIPGRFPPGTDVYAPWGDDPYLYPAVVLGVDPGSGQAFVVYWEGNTGGVPDATLRPLSIGPGARVGANFLNDNQYVPGTVLARVAGALHVRLDGGREIWTTWAKCRVPK